MVRCAFRKLGACLATDWTKILPQIRTNLNKYRNNQFKILKNLYDDELKAKTKNITMI